MLSGWREKRDATKGLSDGGWGPPHPPPEPLIRSAQPERDMAEWKARPPRPAGPPSRGPRKPRGTAARTLALIAAAALGAAFLVAVAALTTGLPLSGHHQSQRLARAGAGATAAARPSIRRAAARSSRPAPRRSHATVVPTTTTGSQTNRSTLAAVNAVVDETGSGRQKVISAINAVQSCTMSPGGGQAGIWQVVTQRQQALGQLRGLAESARAASSAGPVIQSLVTVLNDSIEADRAYMAWMSDLASGQQHCGADASGDANFTAGQTFSTKADGDKLVFVEAWNPLAGRDGLATYQPQDF